MADAKIYDAPGFLNPEVYIDSPAKQAFVEFLKHRLESVRGVVLDLGSSRLPTTIFVNPIKSKLRVIGVDQDAIVGQSGLTQGLGFEFVKADFNTPNWVDQVREAIARGEPQKVAGIVVSDLLGYLPDWRKFLADSYGLLTGGGEMIIFHQVGRGHGPSLDKNLESAPADPQEIITQLEDLGGQLDVVVWVESEAKKDEGMFVRREFVSPGEETRPYLFVLKKKHG